MTNNVHDQLKEIFSLSLKIEGAVFYHRPSADIVHVYTFISGKSGYHMSVEGSYSDWVNKDDPQSLDNVIKKLQQTIIGS